MCFERIYWLWRNFEAKNKRIIFNELDQLVDCGKIGFDILMAYGDKFEPLYKIYIDDMIAIPENVLELFKDIKRTSPEAYDFLTDGHDVINLNEYLKFENVAPGERFNKFRDFIEFSTYIRYLFKKIINEPDEERKKKILKGMLGM